MTHCDSENNEDPGSRATRRFGAHMSIAGGLHLAVARGLEIGCSTLQIFTSNAAQWEARPLSSLDIERFRDAVFRSGMHPLIAHAPYLLNLASPDSALYTRSIKALGEELKRAESLNLDYVVIHPGAHMGSGEEEGLRRIAAAVNAVHDMVGSLRVQMVLETTAGQGTQLGFTFSHFGRILERVDDAVGVGICLDTSHVCAAGYDMRTPDGYAAAIKEFKNVIGLDKLRVVHVNDSAVPCGSRKDRHDHIGRGMLGLDVFRRVLRDRRLAALPFVLETPKGRTAEGEDWDVVNLRTLRGLLVS